MTAQPKTKATFAVHHAVGTARPVLVDLWPHAGPMARLSCADACSLASLLLLAVYPQGITVTVAPESAGCEGVRQISAPRAKRQTPRPPRPRSPAAAPTLRTGN